MLLSPANPSPSANHKIPQMSLNIALIGPGLVGSELLKQINAFKSTALKLNIIGVTSSKLMKLSNSHISDFNLTGFQAANMHFHCSLQKTYSLRSRRCHKQWIHRSSVSRLARKLAHCDPQQESILHVHGTNQISFSHSSPFLLGNRFPITLSAGLPILSTLNDLILTGDEIVKIEGIFSGTLSYIFNRFSAMGAEPVKFSEIVQEAKEFGYKEPDPRDDLNGMDVARKVCAKVCNLL